MIPIPPAVRVWLATGTTDMRRGMNGLALQVQQVLGPDPHAGDLYVFRGKRGDLIKVLWHVGLGMSLYAKRLERGRFRVALAGGRGGAGDRGAVGLHAGGHRLAAPAADLATRDGGLIGSTHHRPGVVESGHALQCRSVLH